MKYNQKAVIGGLVMVIAGIGLVALDMFRVRTESGIWISVGCSLIASGLVILLTAILIDGKKEDPLDGWGMERIYGTRTAMNIDCDTDTRRTEDRVDVIAMGLKSLRTEKEDMVEDLLLRGVDFRIITMLPDSKFVKEREREENETAGRIRKTIEDLVVWADQMNGRGYSGKIEVRGYDTMALDFYWRAGGKVYFGPYWYGCDSQKTVSYRYGKGKGYDLYAQHFEKLWTDDKLLKKLTK